MRLSVRQAILVTVFGSLMLFCADRAKGQECSDLFIPADHHGALGFNSKDSRLIRSTMRRIDGLIGGQLNTPVVTVLKGQDFQIDFANRIEINLPAKGRSRWVAAIGFAHEYGHAYFMRNLLVAMAGQEVLFYDQARAVLEKSKTRSADHVVEEKDKIEFKTTDDAYEMLAPYNELFADMTAVVLARDGTSIAEVVGILYSTNSNNRDFTKPRNPVVGHNSYSIYNQLNKVRFHIWKNYLSKAEPADYPVIFKTFMVATRIHFERRQAYAHTENQWSFNYNYEKINRDFILIFDKEMSTRSPNRNWIPEPITSFGVFDLDHGNQHFRDSLRWRDRGQETFRKEFLP